VGRGSNVQERSRVRDDLICARIVYLATGGIDEGNVGEPIGRQNDAASRSFDDDVDGRNRMRPRLRVCGWGRLQGGNELGYFVSWDQGERERTLVGSQLLSLCFRTGDAVHNVPCSAKSLCERETR
jgi:hypothetical protein